MTGGGDGRTGAHEVRLDRRDEALAGLLAPWLPALRWFPVKGTAVSVEAVGGLALPDPLPDQGAGAEVRVLLVRAGSARAGAGTAALLQVPLVLLPPAGDGPPEDAPATIGTLPDGTRVLDGTGHPAFLRAWLAAAEADLPLPGTVTTPHVITGEQSNTSVILPGAGPDGGTAMLKVFRSLADGDNPDVDVPLALARSGWAHVPRPLAWLRASWPTAPGRPDAHGHLGVLSAFVPAASDGFELACDLAARGASFADLAEDLGRVVGQMHRALASALPVAGIDADPPAATVARALTDRFAWAAAAVPELHPHAAAVAALAERTAALHDLPPRQRVHGDLHLGQVLRGASTWYVLDFEGEPLVPLAQRTRPDLALRDVAGMLRSFDYAAAVGGADPSWTAAARDAFLLGYAAESSPVDAGLRAHLLQVLELDKALYEAVYEARNRPGWLPIPRAAVDRLLA